MSSIKTNLTPLMVGAFWGATQTSPLLPIISTIVISCLSRINKKHQPDSPWDCNYHSPSLLKVSSIATTISLFCTATTPSAFFIATLVTIALIHLNKEPQETDFYLDDNEQPYQPIQPFQPDPETQETAQLP